MEIIKDLPGMQQRAESIRLSGKKIGVVPTMGFLHEGHLSLIRQAKQRADVVITTIFVNPTQFGPGEDFENYPRNFARDQKLAAEAGTDIIFYPAKNEMYPSGFLTTVAVDKITQVMCGASRPTHFQGVTTIVAKLLNLTKPHVAIFGQKDAQQVLVIQQMVKDLNMDVEIVIAPIIREEDGLAMSSRNSYLTPAERKQAPVLFQSLQLAKSMIASGEKDAEKIAAQMTEKINEKDLAQIDYITIVDTTWLQPVQKIKGEILVALAVKFGKARLIDNILIQESPI